MLANPPDLGRGGRRLSDAALRFVSAHAGPESTTLETGAGLSTLTLAMKRARHTCVTADDSRVEQLRAFASDNAVSLETVQFEIADPASALPGMRLPELDLVLLNGRAAFPPTFIDSYYGAETLRRGGWLLVGEMDGWPSQVLVDFLREDSGWRYEAVLDGTAVIERVAPGEISAHWSQQPLPARLGRTDGRVTRDTAARRALGLVRRGEFRELGRRAGRHVGLKRKGDVTLFLSTGRSGTQWLATALATNYADRALVAHEPIGAKYRPRDYLRRYDRASEVESIPAVGDHLRAIETTIANREYIETGFTTYAAIPYFIERFPARLRLVHLVRHPVPTAMSLASQNLYDIAMRDDDFTRFGVIDPGDESAVQKHLRDSWSDMNGYERALFWWTELHLYAEEVRRRYPDVPFLRVRYEDMFDSASPALAELVSFVRLPWRESLKLERGRRVDLWRFALKEEVDWRRIERYPETVRLLGEYGYDLAGISAAELTRRYHLTGG